MLDLHLLGKRIRDLRQKKGLTQSEFAEMMPASCIGLPCLCVFVEHGKKSIKLYKYAI